MAQTSPSEFLTFYRTLRSTSRIVPSVARYRSQQLPRRSFTTSKVVNSDTYKDMGPGKNHTVDKAAKGDNSTQSIESKQGQKQRATDTGGNATQQRDPTQSRQKARSENSKAPGPIIGMEDERGGKGLQ